MVRIAIVGVGNYAQNIIETIENVSKESNCRLVAVAERQIELYSEKLSYFSSKGVTVFDDALKMFTEIKGKCDVVCLPVGIADHCFLTKEAFKCGYHVHVEKPPAATIQEVDEMIAAQKQSSKICLVGFQGLHSEDMIRFKETCRERLGRIKSITCVASWPRAADYYRRNNWAGKLKVNNRWCLDGPLTNALSHQIASMLFLAEPHPLNLAKLTGVRAELYAAGDFESHNVAAVRMKTETNADLFFFCDHASKEIFDPVIEVIAEKGRGVWQIRKGAAIYLPEGETEFIPWDEMSCQRMFRNFISTVEKGDESALRGTLSRTRGVTLAFDLAHESSNQVHKIDHKYWDIFLKEGKETVAVSGLTELAGRAAKEKLLYSDLDDPPPWVIKTNEVASEDYNSFPKFFSG